METPEKLTPIFTGNVIKGNATDSPGIPTIPRLKQGELSLLDIVTSTMAHIAPAMSFFFSSALITSATGIGSPLVIILGAIAIFLLGNTMAEFSRAIPSTGSFITFIGKTFGPLSAVATTIIIGMGYIIAAGSIIVISGGWAQIILQKYAGINIPWQLLVLLFVGIAFYLLLSGVSLSTRWAGVFFITEMIVLVVVSVATLVIHVKTLSLAPFNPANITGGLGGIGLAFPIVIYMFMGWENSVSLAEEATDPRRNIPKAIYAGILLMALSYLLFMYATVVAFNYDAKALSAPAVPFIEVAQKISALLALFAYIAGFTSTMSSLIAGSNAQARLIFNAAREGLLPSWIAKVHPQKRTPWVSFLVFFGISLAMTYIFGWNSDPVTLFGYFATLGAIPVVFIYLISNIALPVYYKRNLPDQFSILKHLILPILGIFAIGFPLWGLVQPGQPAPYNLFPWISAGIVVVGIVYAIYLTHKNPNLGTRVGSIIADEK